jgi:hypothetical protein
MTPHTARPRCESQAACLLRHGLLDDDEAAAAAGRGDGPAL